MVGMKNEDFPFSGLLLIKVTDTVEVVTVEKNREGSKIYK